MQRRLKFNNNGKFKIMQIADTQDVYWYSKDTIAFIEAALDKEKPDLVIFTGDQVKGYSSCFMTKKRDVIFKYIVDALITPLKKRNIPFAVTFGNHDEQAGLSQEEQFEVYKSYENSACLDNDNGLDGCGTYNLPVYDENGEEILTNIYIINSYGFTGKIGDYSTVKPEQLEWYRYKREELKVQNGGEYIPSFVYQHIPVPEIENLLKVVKDWKKGSVRGYKTFAKKSYMLDEKVCFDMNLFGETPGSPTTNVGQFDAMSEKGDILGMFFGHDHNNDFAGVYNGVTLSQCPACGFNAYGPGLDRAFKFCVLDKNDIKNFKIYSLSYRNLLGKKRKSKIMNFIFDHSPANIVDIEIFLAKFFGVNAIIALIVMLIIFLIK